MKAYSYVVTHDHGFAPNPFGRYCTLATCKPRIRRTAQPGDWVIGTGSVKNVGNGKLIYAMRVDEVLTIAEYSKDSRFRGKIPEIPGPPNKECGDNIYYQLDGKWKQQPSFHGPEAMDHDLSGKNVLVSMHFFYFGHQAVKIPEQFSELVCCGRGHRCRFDDQSVDAFIDWLQSTHKRGRSGLPYELHSEGKVCRESVCEDRRPI